MISIKWVFFKTINYRDYSVVANSNKANRFIIHQLSQLFSGIISVSCPPENIKESSITSRICKKRVANRPKSEQIKHLIDNRCRLLAQGLICFPIPVYHWSNSLLCVCTRLLQVLNSGAVGKIQPDNSTCCCTRSVSRLLSTKIRQQFLADVVNCCRFRLLYSLNR